MGGIFFDYLRERPGARRSPSCARSATRFLDAYLPIVERRRDEPWGERERRWQLLRRGRYVEFNLVYDRGTLFGLETERPDRVDPGVDAAACRLGLRPRAGAREPRGGAGRGAPPAAGVGAVSGEGTRERPELGTEPLDAVVVGAGIAGLALAFRLRARGLRVALLEASPRPGGLIRSLGWEGAVCEAGPSSFLATPALLALADELGLGGELASTSPLAKERYVLRGGRLRRAPTSLGSFLSTDLLGARAKLRILAEPLAHGRRPAKDESARSFFQRHFGTEVHKYLIAPFLSGIYAADPERLSARAAFPRIAAIEERHPSLLVGMLKRPRPTPGTAAEPEASGKRKREKLRSISFRGGNEALTRALAVALGDALRVACAATGVRPVEGGWEVAVAGGKPLRSRVVALTLPARAAAALVAPGARDLAKVLRSFAAAPVVVVHVLLDAVQLLRPLDGFGHLVPRGEGLRHLGVHLDVVALPGPRAKGAGAPHRLPRGRARPLGRDAPRTGALRARRPRAQVAPPVCGRAGGDAP